MTLKIAYLDDEEGLGALFVEFLSELDYQVSFFSEHVAFLEHCQTDSPDLVFIDYRLPGTRGDLIAQQLEPSLPKILVTGELSLDLDDQFVEICPKPFKLAALPGLIDKHTGGNQD